KERLADERGPRAASGGLDRGPQASATGADHDDIVFVGLIFGHASQNSQVADPSRGDYLDVKVGEADGIQAEPSKQHMVRVERTGSAPGVVAGLPQGHAREATEAAVDQVPQRVARNG